MSIRLPHNTKTRESKIRVIRREVKRVVTFQRDESADAFATLVDMLGVELRFSSTRHYPEILLDCKRALRDLTEKTSS